MAKEIKDMTKAELLEHIETITSTPEGESAAENAALKTQLAEAMATISQLDKAASNTNAGEIVVGDETFTIVTPKFYHNGELCSVADVKSNPELFEIAKEFGNIKLKKEEA